MRHLCAYLSALAREWVVFAAGGLLVADVRIYQERGHTVRPTWYFGALAAAYVVASYRVWANDRREALKVESRRVAAQDAASLHRLARVVAYGGRLVLCGGIGASALIGTGCAAGIFYVWFMAGVSPWAQAREWGLAAPFAWLVIGVVFAGVSMVEALMPDTAAHRVAVVGVTFGLATLWGLAVRRALRVRRAHAHAQFRPGERLSRFTRRADPRAAGGVPRLRPRAAAARATVVRPARFPGGRAESG